MQAAPHLYLGSFGTFVLRQLSITGVVGVAVFVAASAWAGGKSGGSGDTLVTVGSPITPYNRNEQNEPAVAIDPNHPNVVVAGANDDLDAWSCVSSNCPSIFVPMVGASGVYFSLDGGHSWTQPTYTGWSARTGTPQLGPIGTLPWYYESALDTDGDPALAKVIPLHGAEMQVHRLACFNVSRLMTRFRAFDFSGFDQIALQIHLAVYAEIVARRAARRIEGDEARVDGGDEDSPRAWIARTSLRIPPGGRAAVGEVAVVTAEINVRIVVPALDAAVGVESDDAAEWRRQDQRAVDQERRGFESSC